MAQPPAYNRTKDFTVDFGNETDHSALNAELDNAANSINDIRANLALIQADDGTILADAITTDALSDDVKDFLINEVSNGIVQYRDDAATSAGLAQSAATDAAASKTSAAASATSASTSATSALASKNAAAASETSATASKNTVVAAEANVTSLAATVATNKTATDTNAASALASKNAAAASATTASDNSALTAADRVQTGLDRTAASNSAAAAAASAASLDATTLVHKTTDDTGAVYSAVGTTAQRPPAPGEGWERYNSDLKKKEVWNGTEWEAVGAGATGSVGNPVFYENDATITGNYTITAGKNAMTAGPVSIADDVTVTIPDGSVWTIV
jgi:hypothetical protein